MRLNGLLKSIKGEKKYWPCKNIAETLHEYFIIDPDDWADCEDSGEIISENEEVEVDLQETKEEPEVEKAEETKVEKAEEETEGKLDGYSKKVRKRIEDMTYKLREAERREKAAIEYAQGLQKENMALKDL